jgi:hypothetical protein
MTAMPRYFFNTRIDESYVPDPDGVELRDPDQAWIVARVTITELLREEGQTRNLLSAVLEVTDAEGEIVLEFPFSEVLIELPGGSISKH